MRREELEAGMEGEALVSGELKTDRTNRNTLCSDVIMRCTLRIRTVSNADSLYAAYDPSTALKGP